MSQMCLSFPCVDLHKNLVAEDYIIYVIICSCFLLLAKGIWFCWEGVKFCLFLSLEVSPLIVLDVLSDTIDTSQLKMYSTFCNELPLELLYDLLRAGFSFFQLTNQLANCQLALTGRLSLDAFLNSSVT